jgi:DNA-binding transcriptional ArsR family regulator
MAELTISSSELKVLSSDTRVKIMKLLSERNHTLTELSKKLGLASPTIKQHLELLQQSNLIEQNDEGRKWKYYSLTRKGKKIIKPEETSVIILLATTGIGLIAVVFLFVGLIGSYSVASFEVPASEEKAPLKSFDEKVVSGATKEVSVPAGQVPSETKREVKVIYSRIDLTQALLLLALAIVFSVLLGVNAQKIRSQRKKVC